MTRRVQRPNVVQSPYFTYASGSEVIAMGIEEC